MRYFLFVLLALVAASPPVQAQRQRQPRAPQKPAQPFKATGTIHSFNAEQINMITAGNQQWVVKFDELTKVSVKGEGTEEMLRPGSVVRFHAKLGKRGAALEPISEITLMSPREGFTPTVEVSPEGAEEEGEHDEVKKQLSGEEQNNGGAKPEKKTETRLGETPFDGIGLSDDEEEPAQGRNGRSRRGSVELEEGERYFVVGVLAIARRGKLVVTAGEKLKVRAELTEDARINVDFTTHAIARAGDNIEVKGYFREQGEAMGRSVDITLVPAVEDEEAEKKRPGRSRRERTEREKEGEEPQEEVPGFGPR